MSTTQPLILTHEEIAYWLLMRLRQAHPELFLSPRINNSLTEDLGLSDNQTSDFVTRFNTQFRNFSAKDEDLSTGKILEL